MGYKSYMSYTSFLEFRAVGEFGHVGAVFAEDAKLVAPFLVADVVLIAVVFPAGDVDFEELVRERRISGLLEFFDDGFVGNAVVEHAVDLVAEDFWQSGDFTITAMVGLGCRQYWERSDGATRTGQCATRTGQLE